ncbi:MAG: hypothetical protein ACRES0_24630, partial [Pseudomonas sp.]
CRRAPPKRDESTPLYCGLENGHSMLSGWSWTFGKSYRALGGTVVWDKPDRGDGQAVEVEP